MERIIEKNLSFAELRVRIFSLGSDCCITVEGGDASHIGCTVLAVPRPSLKNDGSVSSTASVLNVTGHKDETICRRLAEAVARKTNSVTVCTGGFHADGITPEQIQEVMQAVDEIEGEIINLIPDYF